MTTRPRCPHCASEVPTGSRYCQECGSTVPAVPSQRDAGRHTPRSQRKIFWIGVPAITLVIAAALIGMQLTQSPQPALTASQTDMIPGAGQMPPWLAMANPSVVTEYRWAAEHHKELQYIPCYCGCGAQGHVSNSECYFRRDPRGSITAYDNHAYG